METAGRRDELGIRVNICAYVLSCEIHTHTQLQCKADALYEGFSLKQESAVKNIKIPQINAPTDCVVKGKCKYLHKNTFGFKGYIAKFNNVPYRSQPQEVSPSNSN